VLTGVDLHGARRPSYGARRSVEKTNAQGLLVDSSLFFEFPYWIVVLVPLVICGCLLWGATRRTPTSAFRDNLHPGGNAP
jgi:hypothetical protein